MLFSESRYDFQRCLWSDIWDSIKSVANPKGMGANHPKYPTTVSLRRLIIRISAFRKKHVRRMKRYCGQHLSRIHLDPGNIVNCFEDTIAGSNSK